MTLTRPERARALISLVPMIDVLLILLVFFMVTSTYLNLDMIPATRQQDAPGMAQAGVAAPLMIRLGADGQPVLRGKTLAADALTTLLRNRVAQDPGLQLVILPSGGAQTQALISLMDRATQAGVQRVRVIRLEARP